MKKSQIYKRQKVTLEYKDALSTVLRYGIGIATLRLKTERLESAKRRM